MGIRKATPPLQEYWENKLNIKYNVELEYYKKLCGLSCKKKLFQKRDNMDFKLITYKEWKHRILETIDKLNIEELNEYSRYLNQKFRNEDVLVSLTQSLLIPFIICIISPFMSLIINILFVEINGLPLICFILFWLMYIGFFVYIFRKLFKMKEVSTYKCFYSDIKEIVDKKVYFMENVSEKID